MPDAGERKAYPLRVDPALWGAVERCAAADLRSINAEVECLLREALSAMDAARNPSVNAHPCHVIGTAP